MHKSLTLLLGSCLLAVSNMVQAQALPAHQTSNAWFVEAQTTLQQRLARTSAASARNVILFVGDGMGISTLTAARILDGQQQGRSGEEGFLSFERFPYTALVKTYNVDSQTPDSAGTMTAMMSGIKTDAGVIGVNENIVRGDCSTEKPNEVASLMELAEIRGLSTGVVSTARITHATPAAAYAKSAERGWEDDSDMPQAAIDQGCKDIASQLIEFEELLQNRYPNAGDVNGIEVAMGGGRRHFLPNDAAFNSSDAAGEIEGDRTDGRNLVTQWQEKYPQGEYVFDQATFDAIDPENTTHLLGLFNESHMQYEADRGNDIAGEPSLSELTSKAIRVLDNNSNGYFLVVESGRIDHAHHAGSAHGALHETIELSNAVQAALDLTNPTETLILVTADHGHVFTIAGHPKRGNPILGKVVSVNGDSPALADDGLPYTTLAYANGLGFRNFGLETNADASYTVPAANGRQDLTAVDTTAPGFHQEALIPLSAETHSSEDIALHASGPGAFRVGGVIEQNAVFHIIDQALGLTAN